MIRRLAAVVATLGTVGCLSQPQPAIIVPTASLPATTLYQAKLQLLLRSEGRRVQTLPAYWEQATVLVGSPRLKAPLSRTVAASGPSLSLDFSVPTGTASIEVSLASSGSIVATGSTTVMLGTGLNTVPITLATATATVGILAGDGVARFYGDGGLAANASLNQPCGIVGDASGSLWVADSGNHRIRVISGAGTGSATVTTTVGDGTPSYSGDGAAASLATLNSPTDVAFDATGSMYIADRGNQVIRRVTSGIISTFAGTGTNGFAGDGGPATSAQLSNPTFLAAGNGSIYVSDALNHRVRRIDSSGNIATVAGIGTAAFAGDGGPPTSASFNAPHGLRVDASGNLFVADYGNCRIRMVPAAAGTYFGQSMVAGYVYTIAGNGSAASTGDGGPATSAGLASPYYLELDGLGNCYVSEWSSHLLRKITPQGTITTIAGAGAGYANGPASQARFNSPWGLAIDGGGRLYCADSANHRIRVIAP